MSSLSSVGSGTASSLISPTTSSSSSSTGAISSNGGAGTISVGGLVSGLNTSQIIQGLLAVQQQQITNVQNQESNVQSQETAYKALQAQLLNFQSAVSTLAQTANGPFDGRTATSSAPSVVTAAGSAGAVPGVYSFTVGSLAAANSIDSQGYASAGSQITTGTFTIASGAKSATITLDNTNNTLQGLAAAINTANVGVTASVINSGSGSQPYHLLLTATKTGTANAITIDTTGLGASNSGSGATRPTFGVSDAVAGNTNTSTATVTAGGSYTGTAPDTYTFTVQSVGNGGDLSNGGTVTLAYQNGNDSVSGTLNLTAANLNQPVSVANGLNIRVGAGQLVQGDTFAVSTSVATVQQAANASVTLGSGSGALTVSSSSNTVNTAIPGVTLNLLAASPSTPVQVTVANDTTTAQTAIQNFVSAYNSVMSTIASDVSYDPTTNTAGVLLGNSSILNIQNQLLNLAISPVAGANPKLSSLSALGITSDDTGQLQINSTTLNNVLSGNVSGVTIGDVRNLFTLGGQSTNVGVAFANATSATRASATAYGVVVTKAALQAALTGSALGANTQVASGSNTFTLTVNGVASNAITVPPSSGAGYTPAALVAAVQAAINSDPSVGGEGVTVGLQNNALTLTTGNYGSGATLGISAAGFLGFAAGTSAAGQDVAGSFLVNGVTESATGSGQLLTGNSGNANTAGLAVNVTLLPSQVSSPPTTPVANLTFTQGLASQLGNALNSLLDPTTGQLQVINQNFQQQLSTYAAQVKQLQAQYNAQQANLETEFTNMETTLSSLKSTSSFISQQTAALEALQLGSSGVGSSIGSSSGG
jgi:flagellar hook-associated protein 2